MAAFHPHKVKDQFDSGDRNQFMKKVKVSKFWKRYQKERLKAFGITQKEVDDLPKRIKMNKTTY
jgi:hypothetical protein